jgi:hypothetical protein
MVEKITSPLLAFYPLHHGRRKLNFLGEAITSSLFAGAPPMLPLSATYRLLLFL